MSAINGLPGELSSGLWQDSQPVALRGPLPSSCSIHAIWSTRTCRSKGDALRQF
jgi:hypothetical protein